MFPQGMIASLLAVTLVQATPDSCLAPEAAREIVQADKLVQLSEATRIARGKVPGDLVSANLCRVDGRMMYVLAILARGGRVVRIGVDAQSRATQQLR